MDCETRDIRVKGLGDRRNFGDDKGLLWGWHGDAMPWRGDGNVHMVLPRGGGVPP